VNIQLKMLGHRRRKNEIIYCKIVEEKKQSNNFLFFKLKGKKKMRKSLGPSASIFLKQGNVQK